MDATKPATERNSFVVGVISDTHGLLRPEAVAALQGADRIIHVGDVGDREILKRLAEIAPVTAIRGNIDKDAWARTLPETDVVEVGGSSIYILHDISKLDLKPEAAGFRWSFTGTAMFLSRKAKNGVLFSIPAAPAEAVQTTGDGGANRH